MKLTSPENTGEKILDPIEAEIAAQQKENEELYRHTGSESGRVLTRLVWDSFNHLQQLRHLTIDDATESHIDYWRLERDFLKNVGLKWNIIKDSFLGKDWKDDICILVYDQDQPMVVTHSDYIALRNGEVVKIEHAYPPHKQASSGKVFCDDGMIYYPNVCHTKWIVLYSENEDFTVPELTRAHKAHQPYRKARM